MLLEGRFRFRESRRERFHSRRAPSADLVVIGSHCVGLDYLLSALQQSGVTSKLINVGSTANTLDDIQGPLTVAGGGGSNVLNVNDQGTTTSQTFAIASTFRPRCNESKHFPRPGATVL